MTRQTFNVHFILRMEKTNRKGLAPIFARIRLNGVKIEISTNRSIIRENWSDKEEIAYPLTKANTAINQYLETFKRKIFNGYSSMLSTGEELSVDLLREAIFGKPVKRRYTLIETAKEHNENFEKQIGKMYSYGSYKNYKTTLKYLVEFIPIHYGKPDIPLDNVDYKFCENYFTFLTTQKKCNNNGANKQIQRVKKIVNYSIKLGYMVSNLTASYSMHFKPANKIALTMAEIDVLATVNLQSKGLSEVRDIFIFQCYTGLSYSDIKGLKIEHIHHDDKGDFWVKMRRQKTEISFSVPLLKPAEDLLKKYNKTMGDPECIFPVLSNQKMNHKLKVIQKIAGITKNLTTHLARHSFATTITLNNNVPIETVSKMLGHTNIRTTQLYAKVLDAKIGLDMNNLKHKLRK